MQLRQMEIGVHGFIGYTGFTSGNGILCVTVAKNAAARNLPLFSASCTRAQLSEKKEFPTFARTAGINNEVTSMVVALFEKLGWKKFALVYQNNHLYRSIYNALHDIVASGTKQLNITDILNFDKTALRLKMRLSGNRTSGKPSSTDGSDLSAFLERLPSRARVVLLLLDIEHLQEFLFMV